MLIQEFYTEEPLDLCGVDIPCYTGESMYAWDNDDSSFIDSDAAEGFHWCPVAWVERLQEGEPICDIDGLVQEIATRCINWYDAALEADWNIDRILHIRREIDLRMGEVLTHFKKKGEDYLGYSSIGKFAVEHLSFSGRLASELMHNYEALSALPLTKKAYLRGELLKSALRHLSRVMTPENESEWLSKSKNLSINALKRAIKQALDEKASTLKSGGKGGHPGNGNYPENDNDPRNGNIPGIASSLENSCSSDAFVQSAPEIPSEESDEEQKGVMMRFNVSRRLAPVWDFAFQYFRDREQYNGPISVFIEGLCANYLASGRGASDHRHDHSHDQNHNRDHGCNHSQGPADNPELPIFYRCHMMHEEMNEKESVDDTGVPAEKHQNIAEEENYRMPWYIFFPPSFYENPDTVEDIAAKLKELASMRQNLDVGLGKLLWAIRDWGLHRLLGCGHIEEYGKRRCDLPKPLMYRLMRIADGFRRHPLIRKAFEKGLLSREQARLILRIVNEDNERIWIDYAAHVATVTLKEEVERCTRIIEYDCFTATSYNILPGFRYITDDRFHELPEKMKDIIRTGSWYRRSSPELSWPIDNIDEHLLMERDRRLEEPWNYFDDVDDFLAYQAVAAEERRKGAMFTDGTYGRMSGQNLENSLCGAGQKVDHPVSENSLCATAALAGKGTSCREISCPGCTPHDAETQAKAREICTMPHGESPAETFLLDILSEESGSATGRSTMSIRFFLPEELYELWNFTVMIYLQRNRDTSTMNTGGMNIMSIHELHPREPGLSEGFIAALLQDYLLTEHLHNKVAHHYAILKRDRFRCQVPGCHCRRNLHVHHIIRRSQGGGNDPENLIVLCSKHHLHILHDLMTLKIEGTAPHNLTFTFGPNSSSNDGPFLIYHKGRKKLQHPDERQENLG